MGVAIPCAMAASENHSLGRLVGLLMVGTIVLAFTGLFGTWYAHASGAKALERADRLATLTDEARRAQVAFKIQVQLWKNLLLRGQDPAEFENYQQLFRAQQQAVQADLQALGASRDLPESARVEITAVREEVDKLNASFAAAIVEYVQGDPSSIFRVDRLAGKGDHGVNERLDDVAVSLAAENEKQVDVLQEKNEKDYDILRIVSLSLTLGTVAVVLVFGWKISRLRVGK